MVNRGWKKFANAMMPLYAINQYVLGVVELFKTTNGEKVDLPAVIQQEHPSSDGPDAAGASPGQQEVGFRDTVAVSASRVFHLESEKHPDPPDPHDPSRAATIVETPTFQTSKMDLPALLQDDEEQPDPPDPHGMPVDAVALKSELRIESRSVGGFTYRGISPYASAVERWDCLLATLKSK